MKTIFLLLLTSLVLVSNSCSSSKQTTDTTPTDNIPTKKPTTTIKYISDPDCTKIFDLDDTAQRQATDNYSIYRTRLKTEDYTIAEEYWKKLYEVAPAFQGQDARVYNDGIKIYKALLNKTTDQSEKDSYITNIKWLYDEAILCYPTLAVDMIANKGYEFYYNLPQYATDKEKFEWLAQPLERYGDSAPVQVINPLTAHMIQMIVDKAADISRCQKIAQQIPKTIAYGMQHAKTSNAKEGWDIVNGYAPARLEELEGVEGFYPYTYYKQKYMPAFNANPTDCDVIVSTYGRLSYGQTPKDDSDYLKVVSAYNQNCKKIEEPQNCAAPAYQALREGNYQASVKGFDKCIASETDPQKKFKYAMLNAKIYYQYLKNFPKARQYAKDAAAFNPASGEPYMLIGTLYASSGPLCGSGTGFDSQRVVWAALDMWEKAKKIDKSVTAEATKLINRYTQYLPTREDIFVRSIEEGSTYKIPCWIQTNTTVRVKP